MKTHIQKWGNSLALRLPKSFAAETSPVKVTLPLVFCYALGLHTSTP